MAPSSAPEEILARYQQRPALTFEEDALAYRMQTTGPATFTPEAGQAVCQQQAMGCSNLSYELTYERLKSDPALKVQYTVLQHFAGAEDQIIQSQFELRPLR
jgi:hypothetical protein